MSLNVVNNDGTLTMVADNSGIWKGTTAEWTQYEIDHPTEAATVNIKMITDDETGAESDIYSTTETKTNKVWIDGKPIYRKVLATTTTSDNQTVTWSIQDLECVTNISGSLFMLKAGNRLFMNIPYYYGYGNEYYTIYTYVENSQVRIIMNSSDSNYFLAGSKVYCILEYTKTTN